MSLSLIFGEPTTYMRRILYPIYDRYSSYGINLFTSGGQLLKNNILDMSSPHGITITNSDILYSRNRNLNLNNITSITTPRNFHDPTIMTLNSNGYLSVKTLDDVVIKRTNTVKVRATKISDSHESNSLILHDGRYCNEQINMRLFDLIKEKTKIHYSCALKNRVRVFTSKQSIFVMGNGHLVIYDMRINEPIHSETGLMHYDPSCNINKSANGNLFLITPDGVLYVKRIFQSNWTRIYSNRRGLSFVELDNMIYMLSACQIGTEYIIEKINLVSHKIKHITHITSDNRPMKLCVCGYSSSKNCRLDEEERLKFITYYLERHKSFAFIMSINNN